MGQKSLKQEEVEKRRIRTATSTGRKEKCLKLLLQNAYLNVELVNFNSNLRNNKYLLIHRMSPVMNWPGPPHSVREVSCDRLQCPRDPQ